MDIGKIEYRVRPVTRFIVTRYEQSAANSDGSSSCGSSQLGEYDSAAVAYQVGYALCKAEHQRLGWPIDDGRISYPIDLSTVPDEGHPVLSMRPASQPPSVATS